MFLIHPKLITRAFLVAGFVFAMCANAQNLALESSSAGFGPANCEKVFVHLNKPVYVSGESLLYKAYVVNASGLGLMPQSKILYFELLDPKNKRVLEWRNNLCNGLVSCKMGLPDSLGCGIYTLRAFTNFMRNSPPNLCFSTQILVTSLSGNNLEKLDMPNVCMPSNNQPNANKNKKTACILDAEILGNNLLSIEIENLDAQLPENEKFRLMGHIRGQVLIDTFATIKNNNNKFFVPLSASAGGIIHLEATDGQNNKICDKLVFVPPMDPLALEIKSLEPAYGKREKVRFEIQINGLPENAFADVSVSISEKTPFEFGQNKSITPYLYVFSEFSQAMHQNNCGGNINGKWVDGILDTGGTAHYAWHFPDTQNQGDCGHMAEKQGFILRGKLTGKTTGKPIQNALVYISYADTLANLQYCHTNKNGNFYFLLGQNYDNEKLVLMAENNGKLAGGIDWEIDSKHCNAPKTEAASYALSENEKEYLAYCRGLQLVNSIYREIENHGLELMPAPVFYKHNFYGQPDGKVRLAEYIDLPGFAQITSNLLHGVRFRDRKGVFSIQVYDAQSSKYFPNMDWVLFNGVPFADYTYLSGLGSVQIKEVETIKSMVYYGDLSFNGLISIKTYDGEFPYPNQNGCFFVFENLVQPAYVFSENAQPKEPIDANLPDFRQTLYWNPSLKMAGGIKTTIEFCTSDLNSEFCIDIQGIASNGKPFSLTKSFKVN